MTQQTTTSGAAALAAEWDRVHAAVVRRVHDTLADLGMSPRALDYVDSLRLYQRAPFLVTAWVMDEALREELSVAVAKHLIGIKLVDDLLDGDTDFERADLGLGVQLIQGATRALASHAHSARVLEVLEEDYRWIWRGQLREKRAPAESFDEWREAAELNAARCLGCYAEAATLAGGDAESAGAAREFARGFAFLVRIADDLLDYQRGERAGNLGHLAAEGRTGVAQIHSFTEEMRARARAAAALRPTAHDLGPVIDRYADDILHRILPA